MEAAARDSLQEVGTRARGQEGRQEEGRQEGRREGRQEGRQEDRQEGRPKGQGGRRARRTREPLT
jgi:predicted transposase YdaD